MYLMAVVEQLRSLAAKSLEKIAFTVVKKYPSSFKDQIDDMYADVGHSSCVQQLVYRVDNTKRSAKRFLVQSTN